MVICNSNVVRPDPIVTDVLILNKRQNISDHRVDYMMILVRVIWIILQHIDTVGQGLLDNKDPCAICRCQCKNPASVTPPSPRRRGRRWLSCHIPLNIKQFGPLSVEWYGCEDGPLHFSNTCNPIPPFHYRRRSAALSQSAMERHVGR